LNDIFDDRLVALRQRFRDRAAAQSAVLEGIVSDLEGGVPRAQLGAGIRRIAHSLAGAGATFGFPGIGACAAELDEFVSDAPDSPELAGACRALIAEIRRSL
jgi:HPt (histidine-containing phosphotransfer) domain-containing protein